MARHNELGRAGEQAAVDMLVAKGYSIVDRNWRCGRLEIDIVAQRGARLVFVEVKTRSDAETDDPIEAVDHRRQMHMVRAASAYVEAYNLPHELQFDIIGVSGSPEHPDIEHVEDAFPPPLITIY